MHYLYAKKKDDAWRLVATFDSEPQLRAYTRWATLQSSAPNVGKFEQGSALAGYREWQASDQLLHPDDSTDVDHNPTPSML